MVPALLLVGILALLLFGPRRGGRARGTAQTYLGVALIAFLIVAMFFGNLWNRLLGQ